MIGRVIALVIALMTASFVVTTQAQRAANPIPACCDVPVADSCLYRVSCSGKGTIETGAVRNVACPHNRNLMVAGPATVVLRLGRNQRCDDGALPSQLTLTVSGRLTRRGDGFAHFRGAGQLTNTANGATLMVGTLELYEQMGNHHVLPNQRTAGCEACDQKNHLEGYLDFCGRLKRADDRLHAAVTGVMLSSNLSTQLVVNVDGGLLTH